MIRMDAIGAASSGISAAIQQANAAASNIANLQSTTPTGETAFTGDRPLFGDAPGGGVQIVGNAPPGTPEGIPVQDPVRGEVRMPDIDLGGEMVQMMVAQQGVASNVAVVHRAVDAYRDLLAMTKNDRDRQAAAPPQSV